jgi:hypothetical protein
VQSSDARISFRIEQVGDEVDEHEHERQEEHRALDRGQVALGDRREDVPPHARPGEDGLGQQAAGEVVARVERQHRDDRDERGAQRVAPHHRRLAQSLGAGGAHEVAGERLAHRAARHAGEERHRAHAQGDRRQHQEREPARARWRQPAQREREQQDQQNTTQ